MVLKYVRKFEAKLKDEKGHDQTLLWGDPVHVDEPVVGEEAHVEARTIKGIMATTDLGDEQLLEIYVIDVGQGDGVLFKTPDGKWHLVDAGVENSKQMTKKGTANFLRWKFIDDLKEATVVLENVIVTHPDADHYGGFIDVLSGKLHDGRQFPVSVSNLYHGGIGRFSGANPLGQKVSGSVAAVPIGGFGVASSGKFITELLDDKASFAAPRRPFAGDFRDFASLAATVPTNVRRISYRDQFLPGYAPGETGVTIRVLGPILERLVSGEEGARVLGGDSITRNGHSIVLRLDYGQARILLTGDLNSASQKLLLSYQPETEFAVDVAKACHHGSDDVDIRFLKAIQARATVISSGDNEDYSHPRPAVIGASGRYGRETVDEKGNMTSPLVYSTELARSVKLDFARKARVDLKPPAQPARQELPPESVDIQPRQSDGYRRLEWLPLSTDLIYGLVNVRTDGVHILCGTMREKGNDFEYRVFKAGVSP